MLVLRTIEAFKVFDIVYVMTGGGPASGTQTITFFTYLQAFSAQRFSFGAALAYLTVIAILVLAMIYLRLLRQNEMRVSLSPGRPYRIFIHIAASHRGRGPRAVPVAGVLALVATATSWPGPHWWPDAPDARAVPGDLRHLRRQRLGGAAFRDAMVNSFLVATCTVAVSLVVGILGGYALARLRFPLRRTTLLAFLITYMLPPITLIIPLYLLMARWACSTRRPA